MSLKDLLLINFRNYEYEKVHFHPGCNVFFGRNAQGKTNLLEAVYLTARGSSFKSNSDRALIRFGERSAYLQAHTMEKSRVKDVEVKLSRVERKRVRINEVELEEVRELREQFDVVLFAPEHLELVQEGPVVRRRFLDEILCAVDPRYASTLRRYDKILFQRNQLLKKQPSRFLPQLDPLDQQLAQSGSYLVHCREGLVHELEQEALPIHAHLSLGEKLHLSYETNVSSSTEEMRRMLQEHRAKDIERRKTEKGPHRDDMRMELNHSDARLFASQGQSRTVTLSLKLAELRLRERHHGLRPILLLDDVFSELDSQRAEKLIAIIAPYQSVVTTNEVEMLRRFQSAHFYRVEQGKIEAFP